MYRAVFSCSLFGLVSAGLLVPWVLGQDLAAEEDLKKFLEDSQTYRQFNKLRLGEVDYTKNDEKVVRLAAEYYVYRVTLSRYNDQGVFPKYTKEFENLVRDITAETVNKKNQKFAEAFARQLVECFKEVFKQDPLKHRVGVTNAAVMLPHLGKLPEPAVGDFFLSLVKGKQHNLVRLYAFKGLVEYYQKYPPKITPFVEDKVRLFEAARINPVIEFLNAPSGLSPKAAPEEIEAFRYVRREAIRALAQIRLPAIPLLPGYDGRVEAPVAHALLRVLSDGNTTLDPPPSFQEKYEAALGICQLDAKGMPRYKAEVAATLVAKFVYDFSVTYRLDREKFADIVGSKKFLRPPMVPWRQFSERLQGQASNPKDETGLKKFTTNLVKGSPAAKTIDEVIRLSDPWLERTKYHRDIDDPELLKKFVNNLPRPGPEVYSQSDLKIDMARWPPY